MEQLPSSFIIAWKFFQLRASERAMHFVKAVIVAVRNDVICTGMTSMTIPGQRRHAVRPQQSRLPGKILTIRNYHAAFTSDQVLIRKKRKSSKVSDAACHCSVGGSTPLIVVVSSYRMASIFD